MIHATRSTASRRLISLKPANVAGFGEALAASSRSKAGSLLCVALACLALVQPSRLIHDNVNVSVCAGGDGVRRGAEGGVCPRAAISTRSPVRAPVLVALTVTCTASLGHGACEMWCAVSCACGIESTWTRRTMR
jgi:hypothetical protein